MPRARRGGWWERFQESRLRRVMIFVMGLLFVVQAVVAFAGWPAPFRPVKGDIGHRGFSWGNVAAGTLSAAIGGALMYFAVRRPDD
jgi:hypothetical protein